MDVVSWVTAFTALVALVLSQLPPLKYLLRKRQIRITVPEVFTLSHYLGNLNIYMFLDIYNEGGRDVTIAKIHCVMANSDGFCLDLPARTYQSRQSAQAGAAMPELMLGWVFLKPEDHWAETVRFFKLWSEEEEERANDIVSRIRTNIFSKPPSPMVQADDPLVVEARSFFEKKFPLVKGNYQLFIAVLSESEEVITVRGFDFTLFESSIRNLRALADDYKTGAGLYYLPDASKIPYPRLRPMADGPALEAYKKIAAPRGHT